MFTLISLLFLSLFYSVFLILTRPPFPVSDFIFGNVYFPFGFIQCPLYLAFSFGLLLNFARSLFLFHCLKSLYFLFWDISFPIFFLSWIFPLLLFVHFKLFVTCLFPVIFIHMSKIMVLQKIKRSLQSLVKNDLGLGKGLGRDVMCGIKQFVCRILCWSKASSSCPASSGLTALNTMPVSGQEVSGPQGGFLYLTGTVLLVHFPSDDLSYQLKRWLSPLPWKIRACFSSRKLLISLSAPVPSELKPAAQTSSFHAE